MKLNKLAGLAMAILAVGAADATVYLVKEGKVVASYEDDQVDQITFEDPTVYDVVTESILTNQAYYGDAMPQYGYNYYIFLSDKEANDKGGFPLDAIQYSIRLQAPDPTDGTILLPAGTYRLDSGKSEGNAINPEYSSIMYMGSKREFADITMGVAYEESSNDMVINITATDTEGTTYKTHYKGNPYIVDQSLKWLDEDVELAPGTLTATYLKQDTGFDKNCNMNITIAENGYDENGWLVTPGHLMILVGNVKLTDDGKFEPCTWNVIDSEVAQENTLCAGRVVNFINAAFPADCNIKYYKDQKDASVGLIKEGSASISEISPGMYRFTYDFVTNTGKKVTGRYVGRIEIQNLPEKEEPWHLDADYKLNLDKVSVECTKYSWNKDIQLDIACINEYNSYEGDRLTLQITTKDGFKPGIYSVKDATETVGTIHPGTYSGKWGTGSLFQKYADTYGPETSPDPIKGSGITDGNIEVIDNGDETYTINFNLVDDTPDAHKITGTWSGTMKFKEF